MKKLCQFTIGAVYLFLTSCQKDPPAPFLKTDKDFIQIGALANQTAEIAVSSNIEWEAHIEPGSIDWLKIDKTSGRGDGRILATTLKENSSPLFRRALIEIRAKNTRGVPPVTVVIEQTTYDNQLLWQKTLGGKYQDVAIDAVKNSDETFLMAGYTNSNDGDVNGTKGWTDGWLVKLDKQGNKIWSKTFGGSEDDYFSSVAVLPDGGYVLAGYSNSSNSDLPGNKGAFDAWIIRVTAEGNITWKKNFGGSNDDKALDITTTPDGGFAVAGYTESNDGDLSGTINHGWSDMWVMKLNSAGEIQWQRTLGGSNDESGNAIFGLADGNLLVAGSSSSMDGDLSSNKGFNDAWILKLNPAGTVLWKKTYGGNANEAIYGLGVAPDGSILTAGYSQSNNGDVSGNHGMNDAWVMKLSSDGNLSWQKSVGGSKDDGVVAVLPESDGGFSFAGYTVSSDGDISENRGNADLWIFRLSSSGEFVRGKTFGGSHNEAAMFILSVTENSYLTGGYTISQDGDITGNHGWSDYWILRYQKK